MSLELRFNPAVSVPFAAYTVCLLAGKSASEVNIVCDASVGEAELYSVAGKNINLVAIGSLTAAFFLASGAGSSLEKFMARGASASSDSHLLLTQFLEQSAGELRQAATLEALDLPIQRLDYHLMTKSYLLGTSFSLADMFVYEALKNNKIFKGYQGKFGEQVPHVQRWFTTIDTNPIVRKSFVVLNEVVKKKSSVKDVAGAGAAPAASKEKTAAAAAEKTKQAAAASSAAPAKKQDTDAAEINLDLPNAEMGKVVTRFPPEPSGYLHIGHAKAAMLNHYFARKYNGRMIFRFDDTNPAKEKEEYEHAIIEDIAKLGVKYDGKITYSSDYFELCEEYAIKLIKQGDAYVDDTPVEQLRTEKMQGIESRCRNTPVEQSLQLFDEMRNGTEKGRQCVVRLKGDMQNVNKTLRDPVLYRCKDEVHPRTGTRFKAYPTYDFVCPILDCIEGVTHTLRTSEYNDRNDQFFLILEKLGMRKPTIWDYSKLNFYYAVMSKRKLTKLVEKKIADGWDDPRFPTVRGLMRRGLTMEGLKQFVLEQGASRATVTLQQEKLWALNKKIIDPIVPRYTAINKPGVVLHLIDGPEQAEIRQNARHKKNADLGTKSVAYYKDIIIEQADADLIKDNEEVTMMDWGNVIITKIVKGADGHVTSIEGKLHLAGDFKKTEKKLTWLAAVPERNVDISVVHFEHLITKDKLAPEDEFDDFVNKHSKKETISTADIDMCKTLKKGDRIQLERRGYFIVDVAADPATGAGLVLFNIPDGSKMTISPQ